MRCFLNRENRNQSRPSWVVNSDYYRNSEVNAIILVYYKDISDIRSMVYPYGRQKTPLLATSAMPELKGVSFEIDRGANICYFVTVKVTK